jgi:hypothetical protein
VDQAGEPGAPLLGGCAVVGSSSDALHRGGGPPPTAKANALYAAPKNVRPCAGNKVTVTWKRVKMTEDDDTATCSEVNVCQNGADLYGRTPIRPPMGFTDERLQGKSGGLLSPLKNTTIPTGEDPVAEGGKQ